jgi:hypothetical protein
MLAKNAELRNPSGVAYDSTGTLYIMEFRLQGDGFYSVTPGGMLTALTNDFATQDVVVLANQTLLLVQTGPNAVCRLDGAACTPIAGTPDDPGLSGDGGSAASAQLNAPTGAVGHPSIAGRYWIADSLNHRIRLVNEQGVISTVAGTTQGYSGDGSAATAAKLNTPSAVAVDSAGNLFIADTGNHAIRRVDDQASSGAR